MKRSAPGRVSSMEKALGREGRGLRGWKVMLGSPGAGPGAEVTSLGFIPQAMSSQAGSLRIWKIAKSWSPCKFPHREQ